MGVRMAGGCTAVSNCSSQRAHRRGGLRRRFGGAGASTGVGGPGGASWGSGGSSARLRWRWNVVERRSRGGAERMRGGATRRRRARVRGGGAGWMGAGGLGGFKGGARDLGRARSRRKPARSRAGIAASVACARREEGDDPVEWVRAVSETGRALCGREASGGLRGRWALASGVRREGGGATQSRAG